MPAGGLLALLPDAPYSNDMVRHLGVLGGFPCGDMCNKSTLKARTLTFFVFAFCCIPRTAVAQLPAPSQPASTRRILDEKVRAALIARVIWIQEQIFLDVPYAEIGRQLGAPNRVEVTEANPAVLVSVTVDSLEPYAGVTAHKTLQGRVEFESDGKNDIRLEIVANIDAPDIQAGQSNNSTFLAQRGFRMETAYHEQLAGTDIAINVSAGSKDGEFVKRVSECLKQPNDFGGAFRSEKRRIKAGHRGVPKRKLSGPLRIATGWGGVASSVIYAETTPACGSAAPG
jgi:hypothetical protein